MHSAPANDRNALLIRAQRGDEDSLGQLLQSYRNYLHLIARTQIDLHLAVRVNASDIVQETFLQACRRFEQFRGTTEAELLSWLRRILVRNIIGAFHTHLQTKKRDVRRQRSLDQIAHTMDQSSRMVEAALIAQGSSPSVQAQRGELAALVADRLAELSARHRDVIILRNLEGRTFDEISVSMGGTADAARKLWARAIDRLRLPGDEESHE